MSVGFGFSVGDILACGKLCHQIYKACFSESSDAIASWNYLGRELYALGTALKTLSLDDNIIPSHIYIDVDQEGLQKEQRALEAVRMVVGDFKETLRELETMLLKFEDFRKTGGGRQYWLKVKFSVNSGDLDKFRTRIAMHTRAVNLLLNPLIYQQMKGMQTSQHSIQSSVWDIQTRIDTIDQVLHALLFVASEQLTSTTPRIPNSNQISAVGLKDNSHRLHDRHMNNMVGTSPTDIPTMPGLFAGENPGGAGRPAIRAEKMKRSLSHQAGLQDAQSNRPEEIGIPRRTTEPPDNIKLLSYKTSVSRPDRGNHDHLNHTDHDSAETKRKWKQGHNGGSHSHHTLLLQSPLAALDCPPPKSQRKPSVDSVELNENPIDAALRKQAESNEAQEIPIEHWITAAMHWYFKAERELEEEPEAHEVSSEAYLGLMKSTWIVKNVIKQWDSDAWLPNEIRVNVETLIASIVEKFRKMEGRKMPDIRHLKKQDFEIWHKDIRGILVEPSSPLASPVRTSSRETIIRRPSRAVDEGAQSRRQSASSKHSASSSMRISVTSTNSNYEGPPVGAGDEFHLPLRLGRDSPEESSGWGQWTENIFPQISSPEYQHTSINPAESDPGPRRDTFHEWPPAGESASDRISHSLPVGSGLLENINNSFKSSDPGHAPSPLHLTRLKVLLLLLRCNGVTQSSDPGSFYRVKRSPSASTTSTGSSGRRESLNMPQYPSSPNPVLIPMQKKPPPPIARKPVGGGGLGLVGLNMTGSDQYSRHSSISEVDQSEFVEMVGERLVLDPTPVLWASRSAGPFTEGTLKIFWHQSHEYFRLLTIWGSGRSNSQDIPLRDMELIPSYAYEEEPILYLRKSSQRLPSSNNIIGTSPSTGHEMARKGYVYKFYSSEEMLNFQTALTGEDVYQDLVKRVSAVKLKRSTEKSGHTYHSARLQLWHEKSPSDSLLPDTASGLPGISQATRIKLSLQWSRLVIYLGGSDCFITCYVTDDITLKRDGNKLSLVPTKYSTKDVLFKSPKTVKAVLIGGDHAKGGIRLDKDRISSNDEHSFDNFSYIQITFKETLYLNKFETLWNQMMDTRRRSRVQIQSLQREIEQTAYAPSYNT